MEARSYYGVLEMPRTRRRRQRAGERTDDLFLRPSPRPPGPFLVAAPLASTATLPAPPAAATRAPATPVPESPVSRLTREVGRAEERGRADEALALLDDELKTQPEAVDLLVLRATVLGRQRRLADAEADLRRAVRLAPGHGQALMDLGLLLWRKGLAAEAAEALDRAAAHQPRNPIAFNYLAEALNQAGQPENAVVALERSLALDPRQPRVFYLMGRVLDRLRRPDEARVAYRRAQELTGR
jgi:predicted Zn-dependent protease